MAGPKTSNITPSATIAVYLPSTLLAHRRVWQRSLNCLQRIRLLLVLVLMLVLVEEVVPLLMLMMM
jgi:hypothetical protein